VSASWHSCPKEEVLEAFGFSDSGLTSAEADSRLSRYSENSLPESAPNTFLTTFLRQFNNPLIYILALAGVVSLGIGEGGDAAFIFGALTLNAVIGGFQEWRAERSSRALQGLVRTRATVIRGGEAREIDSERVVPGDAVWLEVRATQAGPSCLLNECAQRKPAKHECETGDENHHEVDHGW